MVFRLQLTTFLTKSRNFPRIFSPIAPFAADSARNRYTMGPSIREIRELSTESNTAVPAYSAVEDAAPPCAAMAADTESGAYELDAAAVQKTVDRYNELCAKGSDDDFGKNSTFMRAIDTPPFIVVPHELGMGLSAIIGGLLINADNQVLKADEHTPIDGLFAVGNASGQFFGGVDYPMDIEGLSIGRAITSGYYTGRLVASL